VMERDTEEEKKSFQEKLAEKLADKIAPEPVKPTTALAKKL